VSPHAIDNYLRTIRVLDDVGVEVKQARIAGRTEMKPSSVSHTVDGPTRGLRVRVAHRTTHLADEPVFCLCPMLQSRFQYGS
jgi:hypothetical protein